MKKVRKTIHVAFFVSISSQLKFNFLTEGFIVAMSPIVMAIFIYCYEDLSAAYIACLSAVFSPLIRMAGEIINGEDLGEAAFLVLPDMMFFCSYAVVYTMIFRYIIREPKSIRNFPYAVFFSDFLSNMMEMGCRSILTEQNLYSLQTICFLMLIALCRIVIIMMVIVAIETYGNLLIGQERDLEYQHLLTQTSIVMGELRIMSKNVTDVEAVMKQAYDLYDQIRKQDVSEKVVKEVLSIAKNTHEIKGDYRNVLDVLNDVFLGSVKKEILRMSEIIFLERTNVLAMAKKNGYTMEISSYVKADFFVPKSFQMMTVIRNLLTNAAEAIGAGPGKIVIKVDACGDDADLSAGSRVYQITVRDDGSGIAPEDMANIFMEGYSTKFDPRTGNIHRGMGLCLVRDYVENEFDGKLSVSSRLGERTEFQIIIPAEAIASDQNNMQGGSHEDLHH